MTATTRLVGVLGVLATLAWATLLMVGLVALGTKTVHAVEAFDTWSWQVAPAP